MSCLSILNFGYLKIKATNLRSSHMEHRIGYQRHKVDGDPCALVLVCEKIDAILAGKGCLVPAKKPLFHGKKLVL
jgi:hypothetical protein